MCLIPIDKIRVAVNDILCYKCVLVEKPCPTNMWIAPYQVNRFQFNSRLEAESGEDGAAFHLSIVPHNGLEAICKGFHAYVSLTSAMHDNIMNMRSSMWYVKFQARLAQCVIPKGSEYCVGDRDDIVSTHMVVFSDLLEFRRYVSDSTRDGRTLLTTISGRASSVDTGTLNPITKYF